MGLSAEDVIAMLADVDAGPPLSQLEAALVRYATCVSPACLSRIEADKAAQTALATGGTIAQLSEILSMVSGIGVHSLMAHCASLAGMDQQDDITPDPARQALWDRYVGKDPYWIEFERSTPGFLKAMLFLSPDQFKAFFDYCAIPWKTRTVPGVVKELAAMACDASPAHLFMPGLRLHLANAVKLGAGRQRIEEALRIGMDSPPHIGIH